MCIQPVHIFSQRLIAVTLCQTHLVIADDPSGKDFFHGLSYYFHRRQIGYLLHPFAFLAWHCIDVYIYIYIYVIRIYIYMWQGPLGIIWTYPCLCGLAASMSPHIVLLFFLWLLSLSLSFSFCFSFFSLSLSLSLSFLLFFSLRAFLGIRFSSSPICVPTCLPCSLQFVSLIPSPLLFFSFLLLGCFLYLSLNCCARLCALWDETYPRSLLPLVFPLPFLSLLVHLFFPSAFFTLITVVISGCFWDPRFSLPPMCSNLCPYSANFSPFSYSILLSYSFYSLRCCFCLGFRTFRCFGAINITESIIRVTSILGRRGEFFSSFLSFLTCSSSFSNAFFASLLINYCCSLWVLLDPGLLILLVSHLCPCLFPLFSPSCILHSLPIAILLPGCFGKNGFPGLCFSLLAFLCGSLCDLGRNHTKPIIRYSVTFPYPGSLPYVTLLAFLLVPNLSPYNLSTTVLLSRSPAFGTEKGAFILFPFFHYLLL